MDFRNHVQALSFSMPDWVAYCELCKKKYNTMSFHLLSLKAKTLLHVPASLPLVNLGY